MKIVDIVDLNNDGASDILTTSHGRLGIGNVRIYQNDKTGKFIELYVLDDLPFGRGQIFFPKRN